MEKKYSELRHENERMKNTLARYEEHATQQQKRIDEKMHENTQLSSMLEQVHECFMMKLLVQIETFSFSFSLR
jgi:predicted nuclease with TOPRIM domain